MTALKDKDSLESDQMYFPLVPAFPFAACEPDGIPCENQDSEPLLEKSLETTEKLWALLVESPRQIRNVSGCFEPCHLFHSMLKKENTTSKIGLQVSPEESRLIINEIGPGLFQEWNNCNQNQVRTGDRITSINGYSVDAGDAAELRDRLVQEVSLRLGILRISFTLPASVQGLTIEPCRYLASGCQYGSLCRFSHLISYSLEANTFEQRRLEAAGRLPQAPECAS